MSCHGHFHGAARASRRSFSSCWRRKPTIWSCKNWRKIWSAGATWYGHGAAMAELERMVGRCSMLTNMLNKMWTNMFHATYMKHAWNMQSTARIDALTMFEYVWIHILGERFQWDFQRWALNCEKVRHPGTTTAAGRLPKRKLSSNSRYSEFLMCDSELSWGISSEDLWIVRLESARTAPPSRWESASYFVKGAERLFWRRPWQNREDQKGLQGRTANCSRFESLIKFILLKKQLQARATVQVILSVADFDCFFSLFSFVFWLLNKKISKDRVGEVESFVQRLREHLRQI